MAKRKQQVYSFVEKKHSPNGIAGAVLSTGSAVILLVLLGIAFLVKGRTGSWIGAMGFTGIVMAFMGLRYGLAGFKDESKSYFCCKLGAILGTASIAAWFFIVCIGLAR